MQGKTKHKVENKRNPSWGIGQPNKKKKNRFHDRGHMKTKQKKQEHKQGVHDGGRGKPNKQT